MRMLIIHYFYILIQIPVEFISIKYFCQSQANYFIIFNGNSCVPIQFLLTTFIQIHNSVNCLESTTFYIVEIIGTFLLYIILKHINGSI